MTTRTSSPTNRRRSFIDSLVDNFYHDNSTAVKNRWAKINEDTNGMYDKGVKCAKKGDLSSAEICFTRALNARTFVGGVSDMGVVVAHIKLATVLERRGDISSAERHYAAALRAIKINKSSNELIEEEKFIKFIEDTETFILERLCCLPWSKAIPSSMNFHSNCVLCSRKVDRCKPCSS